VLTSLAECTDLCCFYINIKYTRPPWFLSYSTHFSALDEPRPSYIVHTPMVPPSQNCCHFSSEHLRGGEKGGCTGNEDERDKDRDVLEERDALGSEDDKYFWKSRRG
jgi:hypothetical protein